MNGLTRRSFASKVFAGIAAFGIFSRPNEPADAQLVWSTSEWKLSSFQQLLHEKATVNESQCDDVRFHLPGLLMKSNLNDFLFRSFGCTVSQNVASSR
jgi:hypothetical protein